MENYRIHPATQADLDEIEKIYALARRFMVENGNPTQWNDGYPRRELLEGDLARGNLYVVEKGKEYDLPEKFLTAVFNAIHEASVEAQNEIISNRS